MLLSNEYRPDVRVEKEARALADDGHEVTVLAWDRGHKRPMEEVKDGILVNRVRTRRFDSKFGLAFNYPFFIIALLSSSRGRHFDVVHAHDLDTLLAGALISRLRGASLVYDAHEHYADMVSQDLPRGVAKAFDLLERVLIRNADRVVAANQRIAEYLNDWTLRPPVVVMNCIEPPQGMETRQRSEKMVVFYGGSLEPLRFIEEAVEAVRGGDGTLLRVAGDGSLRSLVEDAAGSGRNVQYIGYVDHATLLREMAQADAVIAMLDPSNNNNRIGTPNRMFEAMAVGTPVLVSKGTLSGEIVEGAGAGLAIEWSVSSFQEALQRLADPGLRARLGENGKDAVKREYNWGAMRARLLDLYRSL
jgi:glycosyltransferase involved in cell wall biosynthesis